MTVDYVDRIALPIEWEYEDVNMYLIRSGSENWLIDAGEQHAENFDRLTGELKSRGLGWNDIEGVCLTHLHPDHAGLAFKMLDENDQLQLLVPEGPSFEKRTPERVKKWLCKVGIPESLHEGFVEQITDLPYVDFMGRLKDTGQLLEADGTIQFGELECQVIKAHGHTPNQVVYYLADDGLLFSGDHVLLHETPNVSLFPEYMGGNPLKDFHRGLRTLTDRDLSIIYPGHGKPFSNGQERVKALLEHHNERLDHCRSAMNEEPQTALDVAEQIPWGNKQFENLNEVHSYLALGETMAHLVYLAERDDIRRKNQDEVDYFLKKS